MQICFHVLCRKRQAWPAIHSTIGTYQNKVITLPASQRIAASPNTFIATIQSSYPHDDSIILLDIDTYHPLFNSLYNFVPPFLFSIHCRSIFFNFNTYMTILYHFSVHERGRLKHSLWHQNTFFGKRTCFIFPLSAII